MKAKKIKKILGASISSKLTNVKDPCSVLARQYNNTNVLWDGVWDNLLKGVNPDNAKPKVKKSKYLNTIQCTNCNDILVSLDRHDYRTCKCGNVSLDGGDDYCKVNFSNPSDVKRLKIKRVK